jgi:hypothetical protein
VNERTLADDLEDAVNRFINMHADVHTSGVLTDLAYEALREVSEDIFNLAASGPDTDCPTCSLIRAVARSSFVLSAVTKDILAGRDLPHMQLAHEVAETNAESIVALVRGVSTHYSEQEETSQ